MVTLLNLLENKLAYEKSELKTGMWVTLRNGCEYMVVKDVKTHLYGHQETALIGREGFAIGEDIGEDLRDKNLRDRDIIKVSGYREGMVEANTYLGKNQPLLWRRKEVVTLTLEELIKKAGYEKGEVEIKVEH